MINRFGTGVEYGLYLFVTYGLAAVAFVLQQKLAFDRTSWIVLLAIPAFANLGFALLTLTIKSLGADETPDSRGVLGWALVYGALVYVIGKCGSTPAYALENPGKFQVVMSIWTQPIVIGLGFAISILFLVGIAQLRKPKRELPRP